MLAQSHPTNKPHKAFALIISMVLMAFVLTLILALSSLVSVETRRSSTQMELAQARANALLGLNVALGELQKAAGPDQRVTATSKLVSNTPGQTHWTGVWNTESVNPLSSYSAPNEVTWLVSGVDESGNQLVPGANIADEVVMVKDTTTATNQVTAGRVDFENTDNAKASNGYAYWISDEGVKAKITLTDPHRDGGEDASVTRKRFALMSSQRNGIEEITLDSGGTTIGDVLNPLDSTTVNKLERVNSEEDYPLINENLKPLGSQRYHDVTPYGFGVLANTKDGGLRKDLSLAFEMDLEDFNNSETFAANGETVPGISSHKVDYLFELEDGQFNSPTPTISNPKARGPTWHLLRNYYRLYKSNNPDNNQSYKLGTPSGVQSSGSSYSIEARPSFPQTVVGKDNTLTLAQAYYDTQFDINVADEFQENGMRDIPRPTDMDITPMLLRMQTFISIQSIEQPPVNAGEPLQYKIVLQMDPVVTIMNPYNVSLSFEELSVGWKYFDLNMVINVTDSDGNLTQYQIKLSQLGKQQNLGGEISTNIEMNLMSKTGGSITLDPGETKVFTYSMEDTRDAVSYTYKCILTPYETSADSPATGNGMLFDRLDNNGNNDLLVGEGSEITMTISTLNSTFTIPVDLKRSIGGAPDTKQVSLGVMNEPTDGNVTLSWPPDASRLAEEIRDDVGEKKHPVGVIDVHLKPVVTSKPVQFLTHYNPRASSFRRNTGKQGASGEDLPNVGNWFLGVSSMSEWGDYETSSGVAIGTNGSGYWGDSNRSGYTEVALFEIPVQPLQSLAALQHVNNITHYAQEPASPIANSYASPFIPKESVTRTIKVGSNGYTQLDWSYLCNNALWDAYYFSTIAPRLDAIPEEDNINTILDDFVSGEPLPNSRMALHLNENESSESFVQKIAGSSANSGIAPDAYETVSTNLMLDGAFNVNSTSVEAWKAVLSATNGLDIQYDGDVAYDVDFPYSRMSRPVSDENNSWTGFKSLTETQVQALATAIVDQVKTRGPFVSLSDFINRRLSNNETGLKGPLQAAIDNTNINDAFSDKVDTSDLTGRDIPYEEHATGPAASGAPGYLRQSDLLMTLGPALSARTDTFKIRAYGDVVNHFTGQTATAWCEAVVQRVPEFVDSNNNPTDTKSDLNQPNLTFGRKFKIVSFRWLDTNEI